MTGWTKIKKAAAYAGVSPRTLRDWIKQGLKHSRLPSGAILIQYSAVDQFLKGFEVKPGLHEINQIVDEIFEQKKAIKL